MKIFRRIFLLCIVIMVPSSFAGTGTGKIIGVLPYSKPTGEKLFFITVETKENTASCNVTNRFVLSDTYAAFDITVSAALAAYHAKTEVTIKGLGSCNYWSNSEDVNQICFGSIAC